jgi:hypothetical protein
MTMVGRASVVGVLLALRAIGPASTQEELAGVASVIDAIRLRSTANVFDCTASTHPKAANSVCDQLVNIGVAGSRQALRWQI